MLILTLHVEEVLRHICNQTDKAKFPAFDITQDITQLTGDNLALERELAFRLYNTFTGELDERITESGAYICLKKFVVEFFNNLRSAQSKATILKISIDNSLTDRVIILVEDNGQGLGMDAFTKNIQQRSDFKDADDKQKMLTKVQQLIQHKKFINYDLISGGEKRIYSAKIRTSTQHSDDIGGRGCGLALASYLIKQHQGTLSIGNKSLLEPGAVIRLESPLASPVQGVSPAPETTPRFSTGDVRIVGLKLSNTAKEKEEADISILPANNDLTTTLTSEFSAAAAAAAASYAPPTHSSIAAKLVADAAMAKSPSASQSSASPVTTPTAKSGKKKSNLSSPLKLFRHPSSQQKKDSEPNATPARKRRKIS